MSRGSRPRALPPRAPPLLSLSLSLLLLAPPPPTRALTPRISLPLGECRGAPRGTGWAWGRGGGVTKEGECVGGLGSARTPPPGASAAGRREGEWSGGAAGPFLPFFQ